MTKISPEYWLRSLQRLIEAKFPDPDDREAMIEIYIQPSLWVEEIAAGMTVEQAFAQEWAYWRPI